MPLAKLTGHLGLFIFDAKLVKGPDGNLSVVVIEAGPLCGSDFSLYNDHLRPPDALTIDDRFAEAAANTGHLIVNAGVSSSRRATDDSIDRLHRIADGSQEPLRNWVNETVATLVSGPFYHNNISEAVDAFFQSRDIRGHGEDFARFLKQDIFGTPIDNFLNDGLVPILGERLPKFLAEHYPDVDAKSFSQTAIRDCVRAVKILFNHIENYRSNSAVLRQIIDAYEAYNQQDPPPENVMAAKIKEHIALAIDQNLASQFGIITKKHATHVITDRPQDPKAVRTIKTEYGEAVNVVNGWLWSHCVTEKNLLYALLYSAVPDAFPCMHQVCNSQENYGLTKENILDAIQNMGWIDKEQRENFPVGHENLLQKKMVIKADDSACGEAVAVVTLGDILKAIDSKNTDEIAQCIGRGMKKSDYASNIINGRILTFQEAVTGCHVECDDGHIYESTQRLLLVVNADTQSLEIPFAYNKIAAKPIVDGDNVSAAAIISRSDIDDNKPKAHDIGPDLLRKAEGFFVETGLVKAIARILTTPPWEILKELIENSPAASAQRYLGIQYACRLIENSRAKFLPANQMFYGEEERTYTYAFPETTRKHIEDFATWLNEQKDILRHPSLTQLQPFMAELGLILTDTESATAAVFQPNP